MSSAVLGERSCQLFRRGDAQVPDDAAMHGVRMVKADDQTREVRTVRRDQVPALAVGPVVEHEDQLRIALRAGLDFKGVDCAEVRRSDQLVPVAIGSPASGKIGYQRLQVSAPVAVT